MCIANIGLELGSFNHTHTHTHNKRYLRLLLFQSHCRHVVAVQECAPFAFAAIATVCEFSALPCNSATISVFASTSATPSTATTTTPTHVVFASLFALPEVLLQQRSFHRRETGHEGAKRVEIKLASVGEPSVSTHTHTQTTTTTTIIIITTTTTKQQTKMDTTTTASQQTGETQINMVFAEATRAREL